MSAVHATETLAPPPQFSPAALAPAVRTLAAAVASARSYGPLRACTPAQAPVIRRAAEVDRRVLPRWQRAGDSIHEWAAPGDYTGLVAWSTRVHWLDVIAPAAIKLRPEPLERHRVSEQMFLHWCDTVSLYAHRRTGRRCIVRPDRLAELMGCAKRTVQRCQKAAEDLGLYVVVIPGRMLTEAECHAARACGSRQRGLSNDAALVVPDWLRHEISMSDFKAKKSHVTPTSGRYRSSFNLTVNRSFTQRSARKSEPTPSARQHQQTRRKPTPAAPRRSGRVYDPAALELARDLVQHLPWLTGVAPGRLETSLRRFVRCRVPWTALDLVSAINVRNQRLSLASMTRSKVRQPLGLLASYLRDLDVQADHPLGPDYIPDPARPRRTSLSSIQQANAARRVAAGAADADTAAAAITAIRAELESLRHDRGGPRPRS